MYGASRRIARGDYTARAEVATQDEIGSVAESFNAMAEAVQKKMWMRWRFPRASVKSSWVRSPMNSKTPMTAIIGYADTPAHAGAGP